MSKVRLVRRNPEGGLLSPLRSAEVEGMGRSVRIAVAQVPSVPGDVETNWRQAEDYCAHAAAATAELLVFPELFLHGYRADDSFALRATVVGGEVSDRMVGLARRHGLHIIMGLARCDDQFPHLVYNSAVWAAPDGLVGIYDKVHLGTYLDYREGVYFAPGRTIPTYDTPWGKMGVQICYDMMFPETSRVLVLSGAEVNIVLSAAPGEFRQTWDSLLAVRSIENRFYSVYANTVGPQKESWFFGGSRIVDPDGRCICQAPDGEPYLLVGVLDLALVALRRRQQLLFRDRVPRLYRVIAEEK